MERKIQKHSTRLAPAEAALDAQFQIGQRVVTPEGLTGRVLLVTESFSPGNTEYQVVLDSGMGGGTYLASQLRPVPDDVRALPQFSNLPAGVTGRYLTEDEARQRWRSSPEAQAGLTADEAMARIYAAQDEAFHTANLDYPEMGTILRDRPDPAGQITMIGALQATAHYKADDPYEREDPDSHNYGWCHVCGEHHESNEEAESHDSASTDWRHYYKELPSRMYRGFALHLPSGIHDHVHDQGTPVAQRAEMLSDYLSRNNGLGMHWTPTKSQAEHYAEVSAHHLTGSYSAADPSVTHVIMHAKKPKLRDIERDPDTLSGNDVLGFDTHEDSEIPLRAGAPVQVRGLSWKRDSDRNPNVHPDPSPWSEHQFRPGHEHLATSEMGDQIDDHGDAPEHGLIPRAEDPNAYDQQSTEGQPDPTWDQDPYRQQAKNGVSPSSGNEGPDGTGGPPDGMGPGDGGIPAMASLHVDGLAEHMRDMHGYPDPEQHDPEHLARTHEMDHGTSPDQRAAMGITEHEHAGMTHEQMLSHMLDTHHYPQAHWRTPEQLAEIHETDHRYSPGMQTAQGIELHAHGADFDENPYWETGGDASGYHEFTGAYRDETSDRWHEFRNRYSTDLHRGIIAILPPGLHQHVHDENRPVAERAQVLSDHFAQQGLGMHWTPDPQIAQRASSNTADREYPPWTSDQDDNEAYPKTHVMFHVRQPAQRSVLRNREELERHQVGWKYSQDEDETPVKPGSPLHLTGISWKLHQPQYPMEPYEHHDFGRPMRHEARVPWTDHQRTLLHSWQVVPTVTEGDFVPSYNFTNKHPVAGPVFEPEPEPGEEPMEVTGALEGYPEYEDPRELHQHLDYHHGADPEAGGWHESAEDMQRYHRRLHEHPEHHPVFEHHHDPGAYRQSGISYEHFHPDEAQHPDRFAGGAQDADTHWIPAPGDVATPEQHADPRQRTRVLHTLSAFRSEDELDEHMRRYHNAERSQLPDRHHTFERGIAQHDAEHELGAENFARRPRISDPRGYGLVPHTHEDYLASHEMTPGYGYPDRADAGAPVSSGYEPLVPWNVATPEHHEHADMRRQQPAMHTLSGRAGEVRGHQEHRALLGIHAQAGYSAEEARWARHLSGQHGWNPERIAQAREYGESLAINHAALHRAGDPGHAHDPAADQGREQWVSEQFGKPSIPFSRILSPGHGGAVPRDPAGTLQRAQNIQPDEVRAFHEGTFPMSRLNALDSRTALSRRIADSVYGQLAKDYPHQAISWVHGVPWEGPGTTALHDIDWDGRQKWAAYNQPERVAKVQKKANKKIANGEDPKPAILMRPAGDRRSRVSDGHHRALGALMDDRPLHSYTAQVPDADGPWDTMHDQQFTQAQGGGSNAAERGPDGSPEDREQLHRDVEGRVATLPRPEAGEDDGLDDSLDFASEGGSPQDDEDEAGQDGTPAAPGQDVLPGQPGMPPVTHGPPLTQGSADGRRERQKGMILQTPQDMQEEAEKKAQLEELGDEDGGDGGPPSKKEKKAALRLFREAARSPSFGFEFTASWRDVVAKAKRLRTAGRVRITAVAAGYVIGEVGGDHDVYESSVQRRPGHPNSILAFACGCPWASFHQDKSYPGRLNGRPCSHAYAVHLESLSRRMNGRPMTADPELPAWLTQQVVVKSLPPWGQGGWAQTWTAPATTQPFYASLRQPELTPAHQAARLLLDGGTSPAAVGTLMTLAGMASSDRLMARHLETAHGWPADYLDGLREGDKPLEHFHDRSHAGGSANKIPHRHDQDPGSSGPLRLVEADQANAPWGSDNTAPHSPVKPYGATEPPQKDMDPGSYGFLAGPDPENWGEIRDDSAVQMPLGNEAMLRESGIDELYPPATEHHMDEWNVPEPDQMGGWDENDEGRSGRRYETPDELHEHTDHFVPGDLERHHLSLRHEADAQRSLLVPTAPSPLPPDLNYPDVSDFHERQESFPYADQANAGGPSTSITPRDPDGIRMEEALQRAIVAASRPDWHIPGDPGAKPVVLDSIKGHESSDEPHHPHDCTCTDCDYHRYHSQHARPVWAAAEHQAAVPDWVRSQRRDRELCERCGNPATSQWAGTGEKMCDDCVDKRRAEYFSEDRWRHQATASPSDAEAPQLSGGLGAELKDEPDAALDPQGLTGGDTPVGGGDAGTGSEAPSAMGTASMGEWGASRRAVIRSRLTGGYALDADTTGGGPGVSEHDEDGMGWDEPSIQTVGEAQWSGAGADSDEVAVPAGQPQGPAIDGGGLDTMASASEREIVAQFQASAAARQLGGHSGDPGAASDGGIAAAARHFLKTGKVLSDEEAGELIAEGRGTRARNLDLLDLEGTHYEAEDEAMNRRGLSLDNFDDDLVLI